MVMGEFWWSRFLGRGRVVLLLGNAFFSFSFFSLRVHHSS